ncbi:anhydro-N-acetylmuramic acid kinase [Sneathiella sp. P13V-1]|nr:anhydro-N-acetylmuramic acid kinase [Sneathiella sp. P13V-1]MBE7637027.1 anhydro-N-acetylmuramic acid kinase [Sneathiella sp. P13V-1]
MNDTNRAYWAIGLMSGTSMDGIDAALIKTDGERVLELGPAYSKSYADGFRREFQKFLGKKEAPSEIINAFTDLNIEAVRAVVDKSNLNMSDIKVIGFHGQTLFHDPSNGITVQVGDGQRIADAVGVDVVDDFRSADVEAGGEGAPFAPIYHKALSNDLEKPLAVLNLGGVGNVTYLNGRDILAFDTGPASAMIDDWVFQNTGEKFDQDGELARSGRVDQSILKAYLAHPYFQQKPPKSLDRNDFDLSLVEGLSSEDGAATLTAFTVASVVMSLDHMPSVPRKWLVTGGGRHNGYIMECLSEQLNVPVEPVEAEGWRGDELEAEAFAFLAVRSLLGMPLSFPGTTGVPAPQVGGKLNRAA